MKNKKMMHLAIEENSISKYVIVPSSYEWVDKIASYLEDVKVLSHFREFKTLNGKYNSKNISICSTGNGGESNAIAVEELYQCGARVLIRVGTTNSLKDDITDGDIILVQNATNYDGVSLQYNLVEYPSICDVELLMALEDQCKEASVEYSVGSALTPINFHNSDKNINDLDLCLDLEAGSLFDVSSNLGIKSSVILGVNNQDNAIDICGENQEVEEKIINIALETITKVIKED